MDSSKKLDDVLELLLKAHSLLNLAMNQMAELVAEDTPLPAASVSKPEKPASPAPSADELRAALMGMAKAGQRDEVARILSLFGASKLTEIPAEKYAEAMEEIKKVRG